MGRTHNNNRKDIIILNYIITGNGITAIIDGREHVITNDNASYRQVLDAIVAREPEDCIEDLFRTALAVKRYTHGLVEVDEEGRTLFYKGEEINNYVVDRILAFMTAGLPVDPLIAFLERLLANPSRHSIEALYKFLENGKMPITEDGFFLGYKGVTETYKDCHTQTFDYSVGKLVRIPRRNVDDDFRNDCSYGFHVGTLEYATGFGPRAIIVKVDPADVCSVSNDDLSWKLRTCAFEVVAKYDGALESPLVDSARPYEAWDEDDD